MYSGSGDGSAVELRRQLASNHESMDDVVQTLLGKRIELDTYFDPSVDRAKPDGLKLNAF